MRYIAKTIAEISR